MSAVLRAGLVGLGAMGRNHARVLRSLDGVELVGVVDPLPGPDHDAHGAPVFDDLEPLLAAGLDYVVVACPTGLHEEVGLQLAEAGVGVLIEKPLAHTPEAARRLVDAFESRGLVAGVGHIERFNPALQSLRARLTAGELGQLYQVVTRRQGPFPARIADVGVIKDLATHDIDLTAWVTGEDYVSVSARTSRRSGREHEDMVVVVGELDGGTIVNHLVNWMSPLKERSTVVTGERGCFVADTLRADLTFYANGAVSSRLGRRAQLPGRLRGRRHDVRPRPARATRGRARTLPRRRRGARRRNRHAPRGSPDRRGLGRNLGVVRTGHHGLDARQPMTTPDVTVVVPVYNTMPYLKTCLESLAHQSIGLDRCEVVAVDDGSTDGSGDLLDEYAQQHPETFRVQPPAELRRARVRPCNRGLEAARGRYVFFLGADDHLDSEALERLVGKADEWESDVIFGRMVGVNDRFVDQRVFSTSETRTCELSGDLLPFSLSNTKLFRRSLIEENGLRYGLDLRDRERPGFTVAAMLHARRISVLGDRTYYFAVRREDAQNISYSSSWRTRLDDIASLMDHLAQLIGEGDVRDSIFRRHFAWEVNKLLGRNFLDLERPEQQDVCAGVQRLVDDYLTDGVSRRLKVPTRLRLRLAQHHRVDDLVALAECLGAPGTPPVVLDGRRRPIWRCLGSGNPPVTSRTTGSAAGSRRSTSPSWPASSCNGSTSTRASSRCVVSSPCDPSSSANRLACARPARPRGARPSTARRPGVEPDGELRHRASCLGPRGPDRVPGPDTAHRAGGAGQTLRASLRLRIRIGDTVHDRPLRSSIERETQQLGRIRPTRMRLVSGRKNRLVAHGLPCSDRRLATVEADSQPEQLTKEEYADLCGRPGEDRPPPGCPVRLEGPPRHRGGREPENRRPGEPGTRALSRGGRAGEQAR